MTPTNNNLPIFGIVRDFVGAPDFREADPADYEHNNSRQVLDRWLGLVLMPVSISGAKKHDD